MNPGLVRAWSDVAPGYVDYLVPRFRPWLVDAVERVAARLLPDGPVAVPGCGPGEEVLQLLARAPTREVVALDPSRAMLDVLAARLPAGARVRLVEAPAEATSRHAQRAAGLVCCFTLQLLERPLDALADWARAVAPGASCVVLFWPRQDPATSWGRLRPAMEAESGPWGSDWEPEVRAGLAATGLALVADETLSHPMPHASPEEAWDRLVDSGSLQATLRRIGPDAMGRARARWLADHRLARRPDGAWEHAPQARLWTLVRGSAAQ